MFPDCLSILKSQRTKSRLSPGDFKTLGFSPPPPAWGGGDRLLSSSPRPDFLFRSPLSLSPSISSSDRALPSLLLCSMSFRPPRRGRVRRSIVSCQWFPGSAGCLAAWVSRRSWWSGVVALSGSGGRWCRAVVRWWKGCSRRFSFF